MKRLLTLLLLSGSVFGQGVPISGLPAATTPLSGSELTVVVQGGVTKNTQVSTVGNTAAVLQSNVMNQGAKCDGTTDDTTAFQNTAALIGANGGVILIPSGVNCVVGGWAQLKTGTVVVGWGATLTANVTTLAGGGWVGPIGQTTSPIFGPAASATNGAIYGLTFVYPNQGASGYVNSHRAIELKTGNSVWIFDHLTYYGGGGDFIANVGGNQVWMTNNIAGTATNGLTNACYDSWNSFTDLLVAGNVCYMNSVSGNNGGGIAATGIATGGGVASSFGAVIVNNTINIARNNDQGIIVNGYSSCGGGAADNNFLVADNKINLNTFSSGSSWGILVNGCAIAGDVHDNICYYTATGAAGSACVGVQTPATNIKVHDNTAYGWPGSAGNGIFYATATNGSLQNNLAVNSTIGGVAATDANVIGTSTDPSNTVSGNNAGLGTNVFKGPVNLSFFSGYKSATWGVNGFGFKIPPATFDDTTTGSPGVASDYAYAIGAPTITNTEGTANTLAILGTLFIDAPVCGTGWTACTGQYSINAAGAVAVGGGFTATAGGAISGGAVSLNVNTNNNTNINSGTSTATATLGNTAGGAVNLQSKAVQLNGNLWLSTTAPTIGAGFGTTASFSPAFNNTKVFGISATGSGQTTTLALTGFATAATRWQCQAQDQNRQLTIYQSASSATSSTLTASSAPTAGDLIMVWCDPL